MYYISSTFFKIQNNREPLELLLVYSSSFSDPLTEAVPLTCHRKKEKQSWRDICWLEVQQNWSQQHREAGFIQGMCSVVACGCRSRTMSFVWLSQKKHTVNKGQSEHVWGRARNNVIPFCGARTDFFSQTGRKQNFWPIFADLESEL